MTESGPPARPYRLLRGALLVILALGMISLVGLFWLGRSGPAAPPREKDAEPLGNVAAVSEGFEHTQALEGKPVFRLRGKRFRSTRENKVELEGVELTIFRPEGEYGLESARALYDTVTREAAFTGEVKLFGSKDVRLETASIDLVDGGKKLRSKDPVRFASRSIAGEAAGLEADLDASTLLLLGPVKAQATTASGQTIRLAAGRLLVERKERRIRAELDAVLAMGSDQLQAQEIELYLTEQDNQPEFLHAARSLTGDFSATAAANAEPDYHLAGEHLTLQFEPGTSRPQRMQLKGTLATAALLIARGKDGIFRVVTSRELVAEFVNGVLSSAETVGSSELKEVPAGNQDQVLRSATSRFSRSEFDAAGKLVAMTLTEAVVLHEPRAYATAQRAYLQPVEKRVELIGEPAVLISDRGEVRAPRLTYHEADDRVHAEGPVNALLREVTLPRAEAPATGVAPQPVRVQAKEGYFELTAKNFTFLGSVQAYQGDSALFADQLRGEEKERRMSASGSVRTLWKRADAAPAAGKRGEEPIEIVANALSYREPERRLVYDGKVVVTQGTRKLKTGALEIELDDQQRAKVMTAQGQVEMDDPDTGRSASGDRAVYELATKLVTIGGQPAHLRDRQGNLLNGRQVIYDIAKGTLKVVIGAAKS